MTEVDLCNLALSHLGDTATVTSISPPDGSPQSIHCARFYPIARDALQEMHTWGFSTRKGAMPLLAQADVPEGTQFYADPGFYMENYVAAVAPDGSTVGTMPRQWRFMYGLPESEDSVINIIEVLPPDAPDDYALQWGNWSGVRYVSFPEILPAAGVYVPQPFAVETDGEQTIILTNQDSALLRYTVRVTNPTLFSPLFRTALGYYLASMLAGPIVKGDAGAALATAMIQQMERVFVKATVSDSNQRWIKPQQIVPWMSGR